MKRLLLVLAVIGILALSALGQTLAQPATGGGPTPDGNANHCWVGTGAWADCPTGMTWPGAAGIALYGGSSAWGTSIGWNSSTSTMTGNISGNAGGTAANLSGTPTLPAGLTIPTPSMTPQSIDCHTACSPTAAQLSNAMIWNYGQGASNVQITGPTVAAGMNFIMIVGTAQASNYWRYSSTTANIYLDNSSTAVTNIIFAAPAVGNAFSCFSFQTGSSTYSLKCSTIAGASSSS